MLVPHQHYPHNNKPTGASRINAYKMVVTWANRELRQPLAPAYSRATNTMLNAFQTLHRLETRGSCAYGSGNTFLELSSG
jgi:hypothetical protein